MPQRFGYTSPPVTVDANGNASTDYTPRAHSDVVITNTAVTVKVASPTTGALVVDTANSAGLATVNGRQIDDSSTAQSDSSDTRFVLTSGDNYTFAWSGATPGGIAQLHFDGVQYEPGSAPLE